MSRVFITGDTHREIDIKKLTSKNFNVGKELTKDDYVIICGDWGGVWDDSATDQYIQNWWNNRPWTTLWIDGNHENFEKLYQYPTENWHGGKIHRVAESIIHLMRGQVFEINGYIIYVMGGANSTDKAWRTPFVSWWPEEVPSQQEEHEGFQNLLAHGDKVDIILTHDGPASVVAQICAKNGMSYAPDGISNGFDALAQSVKFEHWFFGHYHTDKTIGRYTCCYQDIYEIADGKVEKV